MVREETSRSDVKKTNDGEGRRWEARVGDWTCNRVVWDESGLEWARVSSDKKPSNNYKCFSSGVIVKRGLSYL